MKQKSNRKRWLSEDDGLNQTEFTFYYNSDVETKDKSANNKGFKPQASKNDRLSELFWLQLHPAWHILYFTIVPHYQLKHGQIISYPRHLHIFLQHLITILRHRVIKISGKMKL